MKLLRFMSNEEFEKYLKGKTLRNNTKHKAKTNSVGFCFLDADEYKATEALHFLTGVVSKDVCAVFETDKEMTKTYGEYAKDIGKICEGNREEWIAKLIILSIFDIPEFRRKVNEYCTKSYSKKDFKLIKYSKDVWKQWNIIDDQKDLKWEGVK